MACTYSSSFTRTAVWTLLLLVLVYRCGAQRQDPADCSNNAICNTNSTCVSGMCQCAQSYFSPSGNNTDCRRVDVVDPRCSDFNADCVFCGSNFEGPCMKCLDFVLELTSGGTECVTQCPNNRGFHIDILENTTISARTCDGTADGGGGSSSSLPQWAVIVIPVMAGIMLITCVVLVSVFACTVLSRSSSGQFIVEDTGGPEAQSAQSTLRTQRSNSFNYQKQTDRESHDSSYLTGHENPSFKERDASEEEVEFLRKLDYLRTQAEAFLRMLNDMRRRLKELPPDAAAAKQYRNVMRDVTRLLYLVNKKPSAVQMPPDGNQLLDWSQQILERYLNSHAQPPQAAPAHHSSRLSAIGDQDETQF